MKDQKSLSVEHRIASIERHDGKFLIPEAWSIPQAIDTLTEYNDMQQREVEVKASFECLPQDGAVALNSVLTDVYGFVTTTRPGFFEKPPTMITVQTAVNTHIQVPWAKLELPKIGGYIRPRYNNGTFELYAICKRHSENFVQDIFNRVREKIANDSIYRGQVISAEFVLGELPIIRFVDVTDITVDQLILPEDVERAVSLSLWTPMVNHEREKVFKRGVLLAGTYGTGKTLTATVTAGLAQSLGFTVVYARSTRDIKQAMELARMYMSPASMLVVEDIDTELAQGRSNALNDVINIIDGLDSKRDRIVTVMTTNKIDSIEPAAIRQGRISAKILFDYPDAPAVEKLIRMYAGDRVSDSADLSKVGKVLARMNPAEIEEAVNIARYAYLGLHGVEPVHLSSDDLLESAKYMREQADIQRRIEAIAEKRDAKKDENTLDAVFSTIVEQAITNENVAEEDTVERAVDNASEAYNRADVAVDEIRDVQHTVSAIGEKLEELSQG